MAAKTKKDLEAEIKALEKELRGNHDLLEKHDLLPKPVTLQEEIMIIESTAMETISKLNNVVTAKTGRPFITINSRVIDFIPTIAMVDEPHIVIFKEQDSLKEMVDHMLRFRASNPEKYHALGKDRFIAWVSGEIGRRWGKYN